MQARARAADRVCRTAHAASPCRLGPRVGTAQGAPDFVAISRFRTRHGAALNALFTQSLSLCAAAGLVSFLDRPLATAVKVVSTEARDCAARAAVRGGRMDDYRAEQEAARCEMRDAAARARSGFRSV